MKACCTELAEHLSCGCIERDIDDNFAVVGCCGTCHVIAGMRFCPFCGTALPDTPAPASAPPLRPLHASAPANVLAFTL